VSGNLLNARITSHGSLGYAIHHASSIDFPALGEHGSIPDDAVVGLPADYFAFLHTHFHSGWRCANWPN